MNEFNFNTERLHIRPVSENDLPHIHELHSHPETDKFNTLGIPIHIQETELILHSWIQENNSENILKYTFTIEIKNENQFVGVIGMNLGKKKYKNAEIWFKFHPLYWKKGLATESVKQIIHFGFNQLKLHRIEAGCAIANIGSIRVLEKVGMQREAHTRKLLPLKSGWSDHFGYAILSTD